LVDPFVTLNVEPAYRKVAATLIEHITAGTLKQGERLPAEIELARRLGVHRSTVREALRELESAGLLRRERGSKLMMVSRPDQRVVAKGVSRALTLHQATVAEVWEAMTVLEPVLAELAARRRDETSLQAMTESLALGAPTDTVQAAAQAAEFFRLLAAAAGNSVLALSQEPLLQLLDSSLRRMIEIVPQARSRIATAQRRIVEAIERGDAVAARSWCEKHIRDYRRGFEIANIDLALPINAPASRGRPSVSSYRNTAQRSARSTK
jgi:DNA-binding FadR family transcriptional regulator